MKVSSLKNRVAIETNVLTLTSWAKNALIKRLVHLQQGRLIISYGDELMEFGQSSEAAILVARIEILNEEVYSLLASKGMVGCAEAYILGYWRTTDLLAVIRLLAMNMNIAKQLDKKSALSTLLFNIYAKISTNNIKGSKRNISAHYDLGNDFFELFLDKWMMYSSAVFADPLQTLEQASENKLKMVCEKLQLQENDHVLEIGTGWGGLACYMAANYGCKVTTTTISIQQYNKAKERVVSLGLQDKVIVLLEDYRQLKGQFDKLVSIEMIEAVGHEYYEQYFKQCSNLLAPNGLMLIQSILVSDQRYEYARKNIDFIKRYIFPGGCLPSYDVISQHLTVVTDMNILHAEDITYDYAQTLALWREQFNQSLDKVNDQGFSEQFIRMWDFYFCYCQAGFMERSIHATQMLFAKPSWRDKRYSIAD